MKFLIDNQLPQLLAAYLNRRGHESTHVIELKLDEADDKDLWKYAQQDGFILITKDEDFIFLASRPGDSGRMVWVRLGNCRNAALIEAFENSLESLVEVFNTGQRIVELR